MISDSDIDMVARGLVRMFGKDAPAHAAERAAEYPEDGDGERRAFWKRFEKATEAELTRRFRRAQHRRP